MNTLKVLRYIAKLREAETDSKRTEILNEFQKECGVIIPRSGKNRITPTIVEEWKKKLTAGWTRNKIADWYNVPILTVYFHLRDENYRNKLREIALKYQKDAAEDPAKREKLRQAQRRYNSKPEVKAKRKLMEALKRQALKQGKGNEKELKENDNENENSN